MKFRLLAAVGLVLVLAAAPAQAQKGKSGGGTMLIGPWIGLNFASFSTSNLAGTSFSSRTGLAIGGQWERSFNPNLFLRIGAFYSMRGSSVTGGTIKLNYIEFPAVLGYRFAIQGSKVAPYVMAGGQFGIKASCTAEGGGVSEDCDTGLGTKVTGTDIGVTLGGGVGFPMGSGTIKADVRYLISFTNLISSATTTSTIKNEGFTIAAGYMIPFGR
jgi:hypothetical protein